MMQGNLRHKWDDARFASILVSKEIAATPLYHEVKQMIESWAKKIDGNQPTKEHEKELENLILKLDQRVEFERTVKVDPGRLGSPRNTYPTSLGNKIWL